MLAAALTVGTAAGWATFAAIAGLAWALFRGGGSTALSTLEAANRVLVQRIEALEVKSRDDARVIAELRARTDISEAIKPLIQSVLGHETQAQERFAKLITVLDLIAAHLGHEKDHAYE